MPEEYKENMIERCKMSDFEIKYLNGKIIWSFYALSSLGMQWNGKFLLEFSMCDYFTMDRYLNTESDRKMQNVYEIFVH